MHLFGYIRVSGLGQKSGDGPERQRLAIEAFATSHNLRLDPANIYEEVISGTVDGMDRPIFSKMLNRIEEIRTAGGEVLGIVVERQDRWARDLIVGEMLLLLARKRNLQVFCADQGLLDLAAAEADPTRTLIRQVISALSQWEKSALVKKLKDARARKCAETGYCGGIPPFGSKPGEGPCLMAIGEMVKEGKSYGEIAKTLNDTGFRTRAGGTFSRQHIRKQVFHKKLMLDKRASEVHLTSHD